MSLFHTFEDHGSYEDNAGCLGDGDYIFDTPAEGSAAYGCMKVRRYFSRLFALCSGHVQFLSFYLNLSLI